MTSTTEQHHRARFAARGFTLIELLVVIGILVLLIGILLPAVSIAYKKATITRQKADFQTIASALDAYKTDFGSYPSVDIGNTGAAVLAKALFGMGDAAHYYKGTVNPEDIGNPSYNPGTDPQAFDTFNNAIKPPTYNASNVYKTGDIVMDSGTGPNFSQYSAGGFTSFYVSLQDNNTGVSLTASPNIYWAVFNPYDGKDGPGFRLRFTTLPDANGLSHVAGGKVYGPYLQPENFHFSGTVMLDRYDSPILYFPLQTKAITTIVDTTTHKGGGLVALSLATKAQPLVNIYHNLASFCHNANESLDSDATGYARIAITLGDLNVDGAIDNGEQPFPSDLNFLLWSGGPDKYFGPAGDSPGAGTVHDFSKDGTDIEQNRRANVACDDITNFR